ncbi:MAG: glycosyltransferase [Oscillospiraceae bacterium]|nr:glycosyltransferase [Oscillospiraceae bacterium]
MKLSIVIPAYNVQETLKECLDSVLGQTLDDFEVIVINDGSTDATEEMLSDYAERNPGRLYYQTVENGGQGRARNIGMELAKGEYIGFTDSDDWIEPDMFEKLLRLAEDEGSDIAVCDVLAHFPDGTTEMERNWREDRVMGAVGHPNNKLFRRELLRDIRFPEEKLWYEDAEFTAIAIHRAKKISHLAEPLYHYRRGLPSTMNNSNAEKNLDILTVMQHLEDELLPDARDDFEFLVLNHVLLDAVKRVQAMDVPEKKQVIWLMREYVKDKIPHLGRCRSFQEETRNRRLIMKLHYDGLQDLAAALLKLRA